MSGRRSASRTRRLLHDGPSRQHEDSTSWYRRLEALRRVLAIGRKSKPLWWYPMWSLVGGLALGLGLSQIVSSDYGPLAILVYEGDPEAARSFVTLAATAIATITSLTLTITVVTLQLASSQYSPRLIEHYLDDNSTRAVISLFMFTFAFSVATLLNVRLPGDADDAVGQVPGPAISILVILVASCLGALVFFVYRVTQSIRVEAILKRVRDRTISAIADRSDGDEQGEESDELPPPDPDGAVIRSRRTGFYVDLDRDAIEKWDGSPDARVWIVVAAGSLETVDAPVAIVTGLDSDDADAAVESWLLFDSERWIEADYSYGVRSILDMSLKALSPGINDPTTAVMGVQRIAEVMAAAAASHPTRMVSFGSGGRAYLRVRSWSATLDDVIRQLALYGRDDVNVVNSVIDMLWALTWMRSDVDRVDQIRRAARLFNTLVTEGVERPEPDRRVIAKAFAALERGFEGDITAGILRDD